MQFQSFHWLGHHIAYEPLYIMLYKYGKRTRDFLRALISELHAFLAYFLAKENTGVF